MYMHTLTYTQEAIRLLLSGKSVFSEEHNMSSYHYNGSQRWTARERQQFRRAWRVHRKQFHLLKSAVSQSERGSETERLLENQRSSPFSLKSAVSQSERGSKTERLLENQRSSPFSLKSAVSQSERGSETERLLENQRSSPF